MITSYYSTVQSAAVVMINPVRYIQFRVYCTSYGSLSTGEITEIIVTTQTNQNVSSNNISSILNDGVLNYYPNYIAYQQTSTQTMNLGAIYDVKSITFYVVTATGGKVSDQGQVRITPFKTSPDNITWKTYSESFVNTWTDVQQSGSPSAWRVNYRTYTL